MQINGCYVTIRGYVLIKTITVSLNKLIRGGIFVMRKLWMLIAAVFAVSLMMTAGLQAATTTKSKAAVAKKSQPAKVVKKAKPVAKPKSAVRCRTVCTPKKKTVRRSTPARAARGPVAPVVHVPQQPAPVANVPAQPAPVVNVPAQPAPVVNVPPSPPNVGITVDNCSIYIVRENQLMVLDKNTYCLKKSVPLE